MHFLVLYIFGVLSLVVLFIVGYSFYVSLTSEPSSQGDEKGLQLVPIFYISDDYSAVTENAEPISIKELHQTISTIEGKKIQGLKGKMYAFKKHDQQGEEQLRSFFEWTQVCNDLEGFISLKIRAVDAGISISHAIVDIMFLMSQNNENELEAKFHVFEEALTLVKSDECTLVVSRILDLIQLKRKKDSEKAAMEMVTRASGGKNVITDEEVKMHGKYDDGDSLTPTFLDRIMFLLLKKIFWVYNQLPSTESLLIKQLPSTTVLSVLEVELLTIHSEEVDEFGAVSEDWKENEYYQAMESKINQLWHGLKQ